MLGNLLVFIIRLKSLPSKSLIKMMELSTVYKDSLNQLIQSTLVINAINRLAYRLTYRFTYRLTYRLAYRLTYRKILSKLAWIILYTDGHAMTI